MNGSHGNISIPLPDYVALIISRLEAAGHEAVIVGGCVRDALLGVPIHDYDVATSALPDETAEIFADFDVIGTGMKHGTVTAVVGKNPVEITTYRIDGAYTDRRRPDTVAFTPNLVEDLRRRDFTVNAMAYSARTGLIDLFDGRGDLSNKIIRCVGCPDTRFNEDGLRILRALRFASTLGFTVEPETSASVRRHRELLTAVSAERIFAEFTKLICGASASEIIGEYTDVISVFAPEAAFANTRYLSRAPSDKAVRYAILLADNDGYGDTARIVLNRLRSDKRTISDTAALISLTRAGGISETVPMKRAISRVGAELFGRFIGMIQAFGRANVVGVADVNAVGAEYERIIGAGECCSLSTLAVNGRDMLSIGISQGGEIGRILDELLEGVIEGRLPNERDALLDEAVRIRNGKK